MDNRTIVAIGVVILFSIVSFWGGLEFAKKNKIDNLNKKDIQSLSSIIGENGGRISIQIEEGETPEIYDSEGIRISAYNKLDASRIMSMFGLSAGEVLAKDQGIDATPKGDVSVGESKGFGILEQIWVKIKDFFKLGLLILLILGLLCLIPATAPFAGAVLRWIASLIPALGSIVERLFSHFQYAKPLNQVVVANEDYKDSIAKADYLTDVQKQKLNDEFKRVQNENQDDSTQKQIKTLKVKKGMT